MSAMETPDRNAIERLRHWIGERLTSRDLNAQLGHEASLRWWHNRALHAAYGVAEGLAVRIAKNGGLQRVEVAPGLAFDGFGREIVLRETRSIDMPPTEPAEAKGWVLLLTVPSSRRTAPRLLWRPARVAPGCGGVAIASGGYGQSQVFNLFSASGKAFHFNASRVRPLARPKIESGATVQGRTDWQPWEYPSVASSKTSVSTFALTALAPAFHSSTEFLAGGIQVEIDTSAAGFTETPCYFGWLHGDPWERAKYGIVPVPLTRIVGETPTSFVFEIWASDLGSVEDVDADGIVNRTEAFADLLTLARRELYVCWLGIESHVHASSTSGGIHHGIA